jgi:SAM-dependent methyltransferase
VKRHDPRDWGSLARGFDEHVCHVLSEEREGRVEAAIRASVGRGDRVADFGCGTGRALPLLAELAKTVDAYDFAPHLLEVAVRAMAKRKNVACRVADLSDEDLALPPVDAGVCVNALLSPSAPLRAKILTTISRTVRAGGALVLVVPSVESALLTMHRNVEIHLREGWADRAARAGADVTGVTAAGVRDGVLERGGVRTKHYLREELELLLESFGWSIEAIEKAEYDWSTEFESPPDWMRAPYPWDWIVRAVGVPRRSREPSPPVGRDAACAVALDQCADGVGG